MEIKCSFLGGLEFIFGTSSLTLPVPVGTTVNDAARILAETRIVKDADHFYSREMSSLQYGVLAMINDADVFIFDGLETVLSPNDELVFISQVHAG